MSMSIFSFGNAVIFLLFIALGISIAIAVEVIFKIIDAATEALGLNLKRSECSFKQEHNRELVQKSLPLVAALAVIGYCGYNSYFVIMTIIVLLTTVHTTKKAIA